MTKKLDVGGQAVIEGVMMRGKKSYVIAVRKGKSIKIKKEKVPKSKYKFFKLPVVRGFVNLVEFLIIGMKALEWSSKQSLDDEEEISKKEIGFAFVFALALSVLLFIVAPFFLTKLVSNDPGFWFNLIDGFFRIAIFVLYLLFISLFKDVKILFKYHGAEHMAINCYEAGKKLSVKNARKFSRLHPRCGTSFLIIVLIVSILVFSVIVDNRWQVKLLSRIVLIPVIAGVSYEILKLSSKVKDNFIVKILIAPGLLVQRLTTSEPDDKQLQVGVRSLQEVLKLES